MDNISIKVYKLRIEKSWIYLVMEIWILRVNTLVVHEYNFY